MISNRNILHFVVVFAVLVLLVPGPSPAETRNGEKYTTPAIRGGIINLNNIVVNKAAREIRLSVRLAINEGILEFFLVGDHGKTYESVFKIADNQPSELNFALLLIGSDPLPFDRLTELSNREDGLEILNRMHQNSLLEIDVYQDGQKIPFYSMVADRESKNRPPVWVHTGSVFLADNRYAADLESGYIGLWPSKLAVINLFSGNKNPYRGDFGFEMQKGRNIDDIYELIIRRPL